MVERMSEDVKAQVYQNMMDVLDIAKKVVDTTPTFTVKSSTEYRMSIFAVARMIEDALLG